MRTSSATHKLRFFSNPTAPMLAAVAALQGLTKGLATAAFAEATHDDGAKFMRDTGLTRGKLSQRNVERLLAGIPDGLLAEAEAELEPRLLDMGDPVQWRGFESRRRRLAAERRRSIIDHLVERFGFMDHGQLFLKDGEPHSIVGHPYQLEAEELGKALRIARLWDFKIQIVGRSWYYPGQSITVWIHRPAEVRSPQPREFQAGEVARADANFEAMQNARPQAELTTTDDATDPSPEAA